MPANPHTRIDISGRRSDPDSRLLTVCALGLIVASEYKLRRRPPEQAVSGAPDFLVVLEITAYALVACLLFLRFRPTPRWRTTDWVTLAGYGYVAVLVLSALYSPYFELAVVRAWQMVVVLALTRSMARHATRATMHHIAHWYVVLVAGSVVFGVLVPFPRLESQPDRFTWLYLHPVVAGQFLMIAVVVLGAYLLGQRILRPGPHWPVPVYLALLVICTGGLIGTHTRGATAGAVIGLLATAWIRWRGVRRVEVTAALCLTLLTLGLATTSMLESYFLRDGSLQRLATLNSRTELWGYAFEAFGRQPLYGYGLSASRGLFLDEMGLGGGHNALVNVLVNTGVLGTAVWLLLLAGIFTNATYAGRQWREPRLDRTILIGVLLALLANAMFTEALGAPSNVAGIWLFVLAAWSGMIRSEATTPIRMSTAGTEPGRRS